MSLVCVGQLRIAYSNSMLNFGRRHSCSRYQDMHGPGRCNSWCPAFKIVCPVSPNDWLELERHYLHLLHSQLHCTTWKTTWYTYHHHLWSAAMVEGNVDHPLGARWKPHATYCVEARCLSHGNELPWQNRSPHPNRKGSIQVCAGAYPTGCCAERTPPADDVAELKLDCPLTWWLSRCSWRVWRPAGVNKRNRNDSATACSEKNRAMQELTGVKYSTGEQNK